MEGGVLVNSKLHFTNNFDTQPCAIIRLAVHCTCLQHSTYTKELLGVSWDTRGERELG